MRIHLHAGDRRALRALFKLADDSDREVASYMNAGELLVAEESGEPLGQVLLIETDEAGTIEIKSMAVREDRQGLGVGRALVDAAVARCRSRGVRRLLVATAAADVGNLRFYQRLGFRMLRVERDAFTPAHGYEDGAAIDGIPLRDRVWFDREV